MNLNNFQMRSRLFAAGLCGAGVLTFTALNQQVKAQDQPDVPKGENQTQQDRATDAADLEKQEPKTNSKIDLSDASFEAEVVRTVGRSALIVQANKIEFLLPSSAVSLATEKGPNTELTAADKETNRTEVEVRPEEAASQDTEVATTDDANVTANNTAEVVTVESDKSDSLQENGFKPGDKVRVSFDSTDADLVALENKVLTVRTQQSVVQLPAEAISEAVMSKVAFLANIEGETRIMTLQEALDNNRKLLVSQEWSTQMPQDAEVGVIVANNPGRLLLATVSKDMIELVQVPQSMEAGEAVSLKTSEAGDVAVSPLDGAGTITYDMTEFKGTLVSQNSDFMILESGEHHLVLPAGLKLKGDEKNKGESDNLKTEVTVILPAGNAEMVAQHENNVVLETEHGMAQLPLDLLNQSEDTMKSVDVSSKTESETAVKN